MTRYMWKLEKGPLYWQKRYLIVTLRQFQTMSNYNVQYPPARIGEVETATINVGLFLFGDALEGASQFGCTSSFREFPKEVKPFVL